MPDALTTPEAFISHWQKAEANERANSQSFLISLAHILGVPLPSNNHADGYSFEFPVKVPGGSSTNFIDLYRRAHFILESKQFTAQKMAQSALELTAIEAGTAADKKKSGPVRGTGGWDDAMIRAKGQAERYVRYLPAEEPNPPFIIVCDVGHSFEVYADFTQNGKAYLPFPDPRTFRIQLKDLADEKIRERLQLIWTNPLALDPSKISAEVTREIAGYLAELAKSLEHEKHDPEVVAQFLTRCLFCMFAEDVGLLPDRAFSELLNSVPKDGTGFEDLVGTLFREMNKGTGKGISVVLRKKLLQFNGGLFQDDTVLPVNGFQLGLLRKAANQQWKNVEPAIFGTLLERALVPEERHALGAHFTPRAYVERLVLPTVIDPLREEFENVYAAAVTLATKGDLKKARQEMNAFHDRLCQVRVLDPACGSGNFLYVALQQLKILEGELLDRAAQFGEDMKLELETHTIDPHQFLGIELNPRAASIAELVLWIGYLQWHFKIHGQRTPPEPILRAFKNIECRDAVLQYDGEPQPARDEAGHIITVWDRRSTKTDLVTNRNVPDETKRVPLLTYSNPRPAVWPEADYIVGNPPFIGNKRMRIALGDGYVEALRASYPAVSESADLVMYWWQNAALLLEKKQLHRFGLITTNSVSQSFSRDVIEHHLKDISLVFAVPDHPWVDSAEGANVRIAMTVLSNGIREGTLATVVLETQGEEGAAQVSFKTIKGRIAANLTVGAEIGEMKPLKSNEGMALRGMTLVGEGFMLKGAEAAPFLQPDGNGGDSSALHIKPYVSGQDITGAPRRMFVIDLYGMSEETVRRDHPLLYQLVLNRVKPDRDARKHTPDGAAYAKKWWEFGKPRPAIRHAVKSLTRYIATSMTAKHRTFTFLKHDCLPDQGLIVFPIDDGFHLGVLSSRIHVTFALAAGGRLGVGNDPRYNNSVCSDPFPFPLCNEAEKERIRKLAEELDAHRKRVQTQHPDLTLTGMYNVLEKLRADQPLTDKERSIHDRGLVSILQQLHDGLDAAVFDAYGWGHLWKAHEDAQSGTLFDFKTGASVLLDCDPAGFTASVAAFEKELDAEILTRLVALNAERAAEEKRGIIHWLRPEYQNKPGKDTTTQDTLDLPEKKRGKKSEVRSQKSAKGSTKPTAKTPWPKSLADRIRATEQALHAAKTTVTATDLTQHFTRANPHDIQEILESLVTLGRARREGERFSV